MGQYQGKCKTVEGCQSEETSATKSTVKNREKQNVASATIDSESSSSAKSTGTLANSIFLTIVSSSSKSFTTAETTTAVTSEPSSGGSPTSHTRSTAEKLASETGSSPTSGTSMKKASHSTTDAPATTTDPSCWTQNQSPHMEGIVSPFCYCTRGTETLKYPLTTPTSSIYVPASACLYKVIPVSSVAQ